MRLIWVNMNLHRICPNIISGILIGDVIPLIFLRHKSYNEDVTSRTVTPNRGVAFRSTQS